MNDLVVDRVSKRFGEKTVLRDFSLRVPEGKTVCVMGRSGCGKTTLLRLIAGLTAPDAGTILGVPARVSAVFQEDRLCEGFSAVSNVRLVTGRTRAEEEIRAHLDALGLSGSADLPVRELSGGMKRRVALARAVLYDGALVLLDEPFKGLDEQTRDDAIDYVRRHTDGKTVVLITHDETVAARFGGETLRMDDPQA